MRSSRYRRLYTALYLRLNAGTCECNPEVQDRLDAFDQFDVTKAEHWMPPSFRPSSTISATVSLVQLLKSFSWVMRKKVVQVQTRMAMAYSITTSGWTLFVPILRTAVVASVMQPTPATLQLMVKHVSATRSASSVRKSNRRPVLKVMASQSASVQSSHAHL